MQAETAEPYRVRLVVRRTNDAFEASWIETDGQESDTFPLGLPLDARAKSDLRWYLEDYVGFVGAGDRVLAAELGGRHPAAGMALLAREEANFRSALSRALRRGARREGARMAETLGRYLQMAGRVRERDEFVEWVHSRLAVKAELDETAYAFILQNAQGLARQGRGDEALGTVRGLIARLESEGLVRGEDPTLQIATSYQVLAQIYWSAHRPDLALEPSQRAIGLLQGLPGRLARGNLAASLGDLANAHLSLGQFDQALAAAERGLAITREQGHDRETAAGLARIAQILTSQQRYTEADVCYAQALASARSVGDFGLQVTILQNQATMQSQISNYGRAVELGKEALALFHKAGNVAGEAAICDSLGEAEAMLSHFDAAEAWYTRARELAEKAEDRFGLAAFAQNIGALHQMRAGKTDNPADRDIHLRRAVSSIEESLAIRLEMNNQVNAASSFQGLGILYLHLDELDRAEENLRQALAIHESLNLPDAWKDYGNLADVARAPGDAKGGDEWQAKRDAKVAELQRLHRGEGTQGSVPAQLKDAIRGLARAVHDVRVRGVSLPADASEALAQLSGLPAPLGAVGDFLRDVAGGASPVMPSGLPTEVVEILEGLQQAVG